MVAERIAAERGLTVIPPYDDDRIIAGQGTIGLELLEDLPDLAAVLVPIGGGGLASGVATAVKALRPGARVIGVEPELAADARDSLRAGRDRRAGRPRDVGADDRRRDADAGHRPPDLRPSRACYLDAIVTVSEAEIAAGVRLAAEEPRLVAEPSGALSMAAMPFRAAEAGLDGLDGPVVAIVSGGNVDPDRYREYLVGAHPGRGLRAGRSAGSAELSLARRRAGPRGGASRTRISAISTAASRSVRDARRARRTGSSRP